MKISYLLKMKLLRRNKVKIIMYKVLFNKMLMKKVKKTKILLKKKVGFQNLKIPK
jgi:hypothetical protein